LTWVLLAGVSGQADAQYPRIANLWGVSGLNRDYDRLSRYGLLVLGGGSPADYRRMRTEIARRGGKTVLLGTAPLMNLGAPSATPWMKQDWYLRDTRGNIVRWWADQIYTPNLLIPDCLDALVRQTGDELAEVLNDGTLDGTFYDSVVGAATWLGDVDTDRDGKSDDRSIVDTAWHRAQCDFFDRLRARWPRLTILANDVDLGHAPHMNGRLFEGATLLDQIEHGSGSARDCIDALNRWSATARRPGLTFALKSHPVGWQGWRVGKGDTVTSKGEVERVRRDFRRMRLGLATTLMTDAYYAYDVGTVWYGLRFWYAEYDAPLGAPQGPAREMFDLPPTTVLDWRAGQASSPFALHSSAANTPLGIVIDERDPKSGWQMVIGTRPGKVVLESGKTYRIEADLMVMRKATGFVQFNVRTQTGGWERHDKGIRTNGGAAGEPWRFCVDVIPDDFPDYAAEWHLNGAGSVRLERLKITRISDSYFRRDFAGGMALLNPSRRPVTIPLGSTLRRLRDDAAPRWVVEADDQDAACTLGGGWQRMSGEERYVGDGFRSARKPGSAFTWRFTAPSTDTYTLFVTAPGGRQATDRAEYVVKASGKARNAVLDQRPCDGGWARILTLPLVRGEACTVTLRSGGTGVTQADALRAESTARYNDGSTATSITLGPLDGVVLLRAR
jgi:hypothetical protein